MFYVHQVQAWLFGDGIAWWAWGLAALALALAAFVLIPKKVTLWGFGIELSDTIRTTIMLAILAAGITVSAYSLGMDTGTDIEREAWQRRIASEEERLRKGFMLQLGEEKLRAQMAETAKEALQGELERIGNAADKTAGADGIVVPEPIARRVYNLRPSNRGDRR